MAFYKDSSFFSQKYKNIGFTAIRSARLYCKEKINFLKREILFADLLVRIGSRVQKIVMSRTI